MKRRLLFIKTLPKRMKSSEELALDVLNDPKYDDFPQYVDKDVIQKAFDEYGHRLNPFNSLIYSDIMNSPNVQGHFLAANIPEIESLVIDGVCLKEDLKKLLIFGVRPCDLAALHYTDIFFMTGEFPDIIYFLKYDFSKSFRRDLSFPTFFRSVVCFAFME